MAHIGNCYRYYMQSTFGLCIIICQNVDSCRCVCVCVSLSPCVCVHCLCLHAVNQCDQNRVYPGTHKRIRHSFWAQLKLRLRVRHSDSLWLWLRLRIAASCSLIGMHFVPFDNGRGTTSSSGAAANKRGDINALLAEGA